MSIPPPVNPDVHNIADRVKCGYAVITQSLAAMQYRLGELAGIGQLDPDESESLQKKLIDIWEDLYAGTLCAIRDEDADDLTVIEWENTYSDGREIRIKIQIEPWESEASWPHNSFTLGDGAVAEHPLGTICYIAPVHPHHEVVSNPSHPAGSTDFAALRKALLEGVIDRGGDDESEDQEDAEEPDAGDDNQ